MTEELMLKCPCCDRETIEAQQWWLDRWLKVQNHLVANKIKEPRRFTYLRKYLRVQFQIEKLDPWFKKVRKL